MKNTRLYDLCKRSLPDYINVWKQLVNVDCGSRNGKGINAVADVLIREFEKISPYSIEKIPMENPEEGCHLLVVFRGKGKGKIMAAAHLDTVFPEGTAAERPFNKEEIERVAPSSSTVLITGESGTGKEMVATSIWREGSRKEGRFIALNCAAIPENLMESELFGYVKGAFTGADPNGRMGKFELANGGVIFLDEIGDMPLYLQSKLLRVLQERQIVRIGSNQLVDIDVRVIAATNKDLKKMVEEKQFREDLYYRLNVIPIHIEPLRNRKEDIEELSVHYIRRFSSLLGKSEPRITEDLMETLKRYPWPGNVRELENVMEYMVNLAVPGGDLDVDLLPKEMRKTPNQDAHVAASDLGIEAPIVPLVELEEAAIRRALLRYGRSGEGKLKAAQALGLSKATLYRKIKEYGV